MSSFAMSVAGLKYEASWWKQNSAPTVTKSSSYIYAGKAPPSIFAIGNSEHRYE